MSYIERDSNHEYNDSSCYPDGGGTDSASAFSGNWSWLNKFFEWDDAKRATLFMDYLYLYYMKNVKKEDENDDINYVKAKLRLELGRHYKDVKYELTGQAIPYVMFIFSPVDWSLAPNCELKEKIIEWGDVNGFIPLKACDVDLQSIQSITEFLKEINAEE